MDTTPLGYSGTTAKEVEAPGRRKEDDGHGDSSRRLDLSRDLSTQIVDGVRASQALTDTEKVKLALYGSRPRSLEPKRVRKSVTRKNDRITPM